MSDNITKSNDKRYGVYNTMTKRFVFGISEPSKNKAMSTFRNKTAWNTWRKWRYEVREIPKNWVNPPRK